MALRTVHQVIGKNDAMIGEYMNLKHAKDMDNRIDVLYYVAEVIENLGVDEVLAEKIADSLLDDQRRPELINRLKSVKDLPGDDAEIASA